uniref:UbiD family decarboxylase n=1 Tax=candidate division WOR-3 bacterium TaxID=2052148 RepID=A0A7C2K6B6_UNCW3
MHWRKYRQKAQNMPAGVVKEWNQVLPVVTAVPLPAGVEEYDIMGTLMQKPVELVKCETRDLYVPASAEIILDGEIITDPSQFIQCEPFGEYTGYYGAATRRPLFKVNCITFKMIQFFKAQ